MDTKTRTLLLALAAATDELMRIHKSRDRAMGGHNFTDGGRHHCLACDEWSDACNRETAAKFALDKHAAEEAAKPDGLQSCYPDDVATLREMLAEQRSMMGAIEAGVEEFRKRWGDTPLNVGTLRRREFFKKRIGALTTALEVMGGAL